MSQSITSEPILQEIAEEDIQFPPGDLWSDEPPLESDLHREQIELLIRILKWWWRSRTDFYVTGNLTIYYSLNQRKSEDFRGPDFFVVLGTEKKDRKSWVVWQEDGKYPHVIVELLSNSTASVDKGLKKQIYQDTFRTLDYFWFDPANLEFKGFHLVEGQYQDITPNDRGWLWSQQLELFLGIHERKLRFFTAEGELVPLPEEEMQQRAEQERQRAEQAEQELERLRSQLRNQGIQPENL
ncbi:MAG TPA: Uma2 family endonuclease [Leptolyngbyaceae cyanobacterium]